MKQLHLVTDVGFINTTAKWLLLEAVLLGSAYMHEPLRFYAIDVYEEIKLKMLGVAHHMAWWSLLGLLSSACCVLQIILNIFSFGCAGFNTVLGPVRPPLIALTCIAQSISWYVAYPLPFQWGPTAATTVLSLLLTFSPELLYVFNKRRFEAANAISPSASEAKGKARSVVRLVFEPKAMGCISCVTKVRKTLSANTSVVACSVSLETASAVALLSLHAQDQEALKLADDLVHQIVAAGFPAKLQTLLPATPTDIEEVGGPLASASDGQAGGVQAHRAASGGAGWLEWAQCVLGGLLGSSCCLIQLGANLLASLNLAHIGCTGFNKVLGPIRPQLRIFTGAYMACYWLWALTRSTSRRGLVRLTCTTLIFLVLTFLPEVLVWSGGPAIAPPTADTHILRLQVALCSARACVRVFDVM